MSPTLPAASAATNSAHILGSEIARILRKHTTLAHTAATVAEEVIDNLANGITSVPCCTHCGSTDVTLSDFENRDDETGYLSVDTLVTCHWCGARECEHGSTVLIIERRAA